jgi:hypothetical protein
MNFLEALVCSDADFDQIAHLLKDETPLEELNLCHTGPYIAHNFC